MSPRRLVAFAGCLLSAGATAQTVTIEFPFPFAGIQAISVSPGGDYVVGGNGGSGGFLWSETGGLETNFGASVEIWDVNDSKVFVGTGINGVGDQEAVRWTPGGGLEFLGNVGNDPGCDAFFSHLNGISADGTTAVGMSWQGCRTSPMRWTEGVGLTLLSKQNADSSARCYDLSEDGVVAVGWDQGLATGQGFTRRASVWLDDTTQVFPLTSGPNPEGYGEATNVNSDGTVVCGTSQQNNGMFRWSSTLGLSLLPREPSLVGQQIANDCNEDASVVVGVGFTGGFPPSFDGVIYTDATGTMKLVDWLAAQGVNVSSSAVDNATGVSADGKTIVGWGTQGPFVIRIHDDPWTDLGNGLAGTGALTPALTPGGPLTAGSTTTLELDDALPLSTAWLVLGFTALNAPFKGGVLVPDADLVLALPTDAGGELDISFSWPAGPSGLDTFWQYWVIDAGGPLGYAASNAVQGTTP